MFSFATAILLRGMMMSSPVHAAHLEVTLTVPGRMPVYTTFGEVGAGPLPALVLVDDTGQNWWVSLRIEDRGVDQVRMSAEIDVLRVDRRGRLERVRVASPTLLMRINQPATFTQGHRIPHPTPQDDGRVEITFEDRLLSMDLLIAE